ncbi:hypothetical protein CLV78_10870 [Aliiruegeria haliotis]|uniref:Uncharacterized protein n=1 Tax=Aliiruegeria haliotis TaxID=1280846 RepID=A0A2T0RKT1_9RHOB|nr:hypothetical protein [Aliiruegeria haliotis]PRY21799.1 hypothetical protein CLV78_10870 [Aliiruegeria haliotis]
MSTLVMTATIVPAAGAGVTLRADPGLRRRDYEDALRFYLGVRSSALSRIIFCENSGADLSTLREIAETANPLGKQVEFLSFVSDTPEEYGKGHSELDMLDRAYEAFFGDLADTEKYWKVTGRLIIENIAELIETTPADMDFCIDIRSVPHIGNLLGTNDWADTRIIAFTSRGYRDYLLGKKSVVGTPDGVSYTVELALFPDYIEAQGRDPRFYPRFRVQPVMHGVGAESGKDYNDLPSRAKGYLRRVSRRYAPALWL